MVNFLTRSHFLRILREEIDKMVEDEGLILKSRFPEVIEARLKETIEQAKASGSSKPL